VSKIENPPPVGIADTVNLLFSFDELIGIVGKWEAIQKDQEPGSSSVVVKKF
jgi:hypothetical protein